MSLSMTDAYRASGARRRKAESHPPNLTPWVALSERSTAG
jgi:hypothetical protein